MAPVPDSATAWPASMAALRLKQPRCCGGPFAVESGSPASFLGLAANRHRGCTGEAGHARRRGGINRPVARASRAWTVLADPSSPLARGPRRLALHAEIYRHERGGGRWVDGCVQQPGTSSCGDQVGWRGIFVGHDRWDRLLASMTPYSLWLPAPASWQRRISTAAATLVRCGAGRERRRGWRRRGGGDLDQGRPHRKAVRSVQGGDGLRRGNQAACSVRWGDFGRQPVRRQLDVGRRDLDPVDARDVAVGARWCRYGVRRRAGS